MLHFMEYTPSTPRSSSFYNDLHNAHNQGRYVIEGLAALFVEGEYPYKGQFLALSELGSPHADFLLNASNILKHLHEGSVQHLRGNLELLLVNGNYKTLADLLDDNSYREFVDRVWQNYFSLVILADYSQKLSETLAQLLITANLLGALYGAPDITTPVTFEQVQDLLRASIVLPAAIFPLPPK